MSLRLLAVIVALPLMARAVSITGSDWIVHFNLPDQSTAGYTTEEYAIRDALIGRIAALQSGQVARLATYSWSASNAVSGGAGPILNAMESALDRGVLLEMVVDGDVVITQRMGGSSSLSSLAARAVNPLALSQDDAASGIMHHKLGLFDYGTNQWVMAGSWNFSQGASTFQWNTMVEIRSPVLHAAYTSEFAELMAGRFHDHTNKSHRHDRSFFDLQDGWTSSWVRFAPYTDDRVGGTNAMTDITNLIHQAETQIVFALNQITRLQIATSLVQACNRGIEVLGTIPLSDALDPNSSEAVYRYLTNAASYATTNRVQLSLAFERAEGGVPDDGSESDLVHMKWMVIDPFGRRPVSIIGSANWTAAALTSEVANDENLLFLHDGGISRALYAQLKRCIRGMNDRADFWLRRGGAGVQAMVTDTNHYTWESVSQWTGSWTAAGTYTGNLSIGQTAPSLFSNGFIRVRRAD